MEGVQPCIRENTCVSGFLYIHFSVYTSVYTKYSGLPRAEHARATFTRFCACTESDQQARECRPGTCASSTRYFLCCCATRLSVFELRNSQSTKSPACLIWSYKCRFNHIEKQFMLKFHTCDGTSTCCLITYRENRSRSSSGAVPVLEVVGTDFSAR